MKDDDKPPELSEKSTLVQKKCITIQENIPTPLDITDIIGKSGLWQIKILILTMAIAFTTAWNHLGMTFLAFPVDHWCARPAGTNIPLENWLTEFLPNTTLKGKMQHSQCKMFYFNQSFEIPDTSWTVNCHSYEYAKDFNSVVNEVSDINLKIGLNFVTNLVC